MGLVEIDVAMPTVLLFVIILVALAAGTVVRYNAKLSKGEVKDLGAWVFLTMVALLCKLLVDFAIIVVPTILEFSSSIVSLLEIFGIVFIILSAIFLIKVSLLMKKISDLFGFKVN
ncbi:MAG: hypothetical protein JW772_05385 [Candidatus Diapherotrites archaeon]|nr:hypothetical protein [Candidatus Diapherotrites archaeon]